MTVDISDRPTVSLGEVVRSTVETFLTEATGPFDKHQVEIMVMGTPEFRRLHDVQVQYFHDLDFEEWVLAHMRIAVRATLANIRNERGQRVLEAVKAKGQGGSYTWYPIMRLTAPMLRELVGTWKTVRDSYGEKARVGEKLLAALADRGPDATVEDVYDQVLSVEDRSFMAGAGISALAAPDDD